MNNTGELPGDGLELNPCVIANRLVPSAKPPGQETWEERFSRWSYVVGPLKTLQEGRPLFPEN